jgi:molybdenum cofactor cytidylyltransferase
MHSTTRAEAARVTAVVPAAGRSARFGSMKLVANLEGAPLIQRTLASLLEAGVAQVVVVTRAGALIDNAVALVDPRVAVVVNPDPERGMFSSIQAGLAVTDGDVVLVLPADMPFVAAATIAAVAAQAARTGAVVVPIHDGRRGHPIAIPQALGAQLRALAPSTTLKAAIAACGASALPLTVVDPGVLRDVDVPGDLAS